ncbi:hypothetical protein HDK90DRAFT_463230 [Phyllosticta capitalensis]|uniref:Uncharacterized protein n=1 Tax=Phyllosticta capitalensis TaxID=121624 RepID=A0ABR1Z0A9_9PEZI
MFAARSTAVSTLSRTAAGAAARARWTRPTSLASDLIGRACAVQRVGYSSQQPQQQQQQSKPAKQDAPASNKHRDFYKDFGPPILKVFLGAFIVYQGLYYGWLKLEDVEKRQDSEAEIERLKTQIAHAQTAAKTALSPGNETQDISSSKSKSWYKFW